MGTASASADEPDATPGAFALSCAEEACPDKLPSSEFSEVRRLGAEGDGAHRSADFAVALKRWDEALQIFAGRKGCGAQRVLKSRLYSKQAAAALETADWAGARSYASQALDTDDSNMKARLRRVRAVLELGDAKELECVSSDIARIKADGGTVSAETLNRLRALVLAV